MADEKIIKIQYEPGESGWAVDFEDGRGRITNIPISNDINIDDVVSFKLLINRMIAVDKVLARTFEKKTALTYGGSYKETYKALATALVAAGMKVEGLMPGHALVAHQSEQDPVAVCKTAGVEVQLYKAQPKLKAVIGVS